MSCICIAGENQTTLNLVAKVLSASGMKILSVDKAHRAPSHCVTSEHHVSQTALGISVTSERLGQVVQSAQSRELVGWADVTSLNALAEWVRIEPSLYFVLVTSKAADALAHAIDDYDNELDVAQVIRQWQQSQQQILHFYYRNRDRCVMVDGQDCLENVQDFVHECKQGISVSLQIPKDPLSVWPKLENSVSLHFAQTLLGNYPEAVSLENELATCIQTFAQTRVVFEQTKQQTAVQELLTQYRSQRAQSRTNLEQWINENTKLLSKVESIQAENKQLFQEYHDAKRQIDIFSEHAHADGKALARLESELEIEKTRVAAALADLGEFSKNNEQLFFELHDAQLGLEQTFERNGELEAQVKALDTQITNSHTVAEVRKTELDQALKKNSKLQDKQNEVQAENEVLLTQFHESLVDLETHILKNRVLQDSIAVEQSTVKALEVRLLEVNGEYESLSQAHVQWLAEREILLEQIEFKQDALSLQQQEAERVATAHQTQLAILTSQLALLNGELLKIKEEFAAEGLAKQTLEKQVQTYSVQLNKLDIEQQQWLVEREHLASQMDAKQSEFSVLQDSHHALMLELAQTQSLAQEQFGQNEFATSLLKNIELAKRTVESRLLRLLQKYPMPVVYERLEPLGAPSGDQLKTQWQLFALDTGKLFVPSVLFSTILEDRALGFSFSRQQAISNGLIRWPSILGTSIEMVLSPVGDATTGPIRAETWLALATSDLEILAALLSALDKELTAGRIEARFGSSLSGQLLVGLEAFKRLISETASTFRYDQVRLKRATVNDDYEHLWLEFENVSYNSVRLSQFECRIACSELMSKRFGSFPKLEFPSTDSSQTLSSWYVESHDDFGDKLELRFAPPELFDIEVWGKLSHDDQGFIFGLLDRLPTILRELDLDSVGLHRPWPQWNSVIEHMSKCLAPAMTSHLLKDAPPVEPSAPADQGNASSLATKPDLSMLGEQSATAVSAALTSQTLAKRPTSSAFLSYLQES
jgi:hypothetical protein